MNVINLADAVFYTIISIVFAVGAFYALTNWRIKKLEESHKEQNEILSEIRDKLTKVDTTVEFLKKRMNI